MKTIITLSITMLISTISYCLAPAQGGPVKLPLITDVPGEFTYTSNTTNPSDETVTHKITCKVDITLICFSINKPTIPAPTVNPSPTNGEYINVNFNNQTISGYCIDYQEQTDPISGNVLIREHSFKFTPW